MEHRLVGIPHDDRSLTQSEARRKRKESCLVDGERKRERKIERERERTQDE